MHPFHACVAPSVRSAGKWQPAESLTTSFQTPQHTSWKAAADHEALAEAEEEARMLEEWMTEEEAYQVGCVLLCHPLYTPCDALPHRIDPADA